MKLGIDIGGTNINLGLVRDERLIKVEKVSSFSTSLSCEQTIDYLEEQIKRFYTAPLTGLGIGVPSVVDLEKGIVYDTANIPQWQEVHLKEQLEKRLGIPVYVNNDSNCYALGAYSAIPLESRPKSLVAITLGTGVGMGIVIDGALYCGANCGAGELSCLPYKERTIEDYCSKKFFLEAGLDAAVAAKQALEGEDRALGLFTEFGQHIGYLICSVLYAYDPELIVLGGGLSNSYPLFRKSMEFYLQKSFPYHKTIENQKIAVMTSDEIPLLGAASLVTK